MIYITGDMHGDYKRFKREAFPSQERMTKQDYVMICGENAQFIRPSVIHLMRGQVFTMSA